MSSRSPTAKGLHSLSQSNFIGEVRQSPTSNQSIVRSRSSSAHKRSSEELTFGDMEHTNEIIMSHRSPKLQRGVGNYPGTSGNHDESGKEMRRAHDENRQWKDVRLPYGLSILLAWMALSLKRRTWEMKELPLYLAD